MKKETHPNNSH